LPDAVPVIAGKGLSPKWYIIFILLRWCK